MLDGHLNKCKECAKLDSRNHYHAMSEIDGFYEKERQRNRARVRKKLAGRIRPVREMLPKVHSEVWRNFFEKYPEKYHAANVSQCKKVKIAGNHKHHWSYAPENADDVIELSPKDHRKAHRNMFYTQDEMCYMTNDGVLLDTKEKHIDYLKGLNLTIVE